MKYILLIIYLCSAILYAPDKEMADDFEYEISKISRNLKDHIMDKDECEMLMRDAGNLADEIENEIREDNVSDEVKTELKALKKDAEGLEDFIGSIGNCANSILSNEDFKRANNRVHGTVTYISNGKFCMNVIKVSIGDYICYVGENTSNNDYTASYNYKVINSSSSGNGSMGLTKKSIRHIYDNREKPSQKNISIFNIQCKPFKF